jgi:DNA-binding beta-propeller fold protein YncE
MILLLLFSSLVFGCFKNAVPREALPEIEWPKPPDTARIRFVNSISKPEHINISESAAKRFLHYFWGKTPSSIISPNGIAVDADRRLYVVDSKMKMVNVYDARENKHFVFPEKGTSFIFPVDVAVDTKGTVFVTDSKEAVVKVFKDRGRHFVREIGKNFLQRPTGIAVNENTDELLVVDTLSSEVIRYDLDTYNYKGRMGTEGNKPGLLHYPISISISQNGNIIVSDSLNFRVQVFSPDGVFRHTFGGPGNAPGYFARPKGVATDSDGNIYVVDALFDNVQMFDSNGRMLMAFGSPGYGYGNFWLPSGIFIDSNDRIYVSDTYNKRVQVFQYLKGD